MLRPLFPGHDSWNKHSVQMYKRLIRQEEEQIFIFEANDFTFSKRIPLNILLEIEEISCERLREKTLRQLDEHQYNQTMLFGKDIVDMDGQHEQPLIEDEEQHGWHEQHEQPLIEVEQQERPEQPIIEDEQQRQHGQHEQQEQPIIEDEEQGQHEQQEQQKQPEEERQPEKRQPSKKKKILIVPDYAQKLRSRNKQKASEVNNRKFDVDAAADSSSFQDCDDDGPIEEIEIFENLNFQEQQSNMWPGWNPYGI